MQAGYETIRPNLLKGMGRVESTIQAINGPINSIVWGWPTVLLIAATGILLMVGLRFMPLQRLGYGISMMLRPAASQTEGEITPFQALMTSLSATIGTGNIAGVAGAIAVECSALINQGAAVAARQAIEAVKVPVAGGASQLPLARLMPPSQLRDLEEILEPALYTCLSERGMTSADEGLTCVSELIYN